MEKHECALRAAPEDLLPWSSGCAVLDQAPLLLTY
jgi:hypothetical protein